MTIYIVQQQVDLGTHVRGVFLQKEKANEALEVFNKIYPPNKYDFDNNPTNGFFIETIDDGHIEFSAYENKVMKSH